MAKTLNLLLFMDAMQTVIFAVDSHALKSS